MWRSLDYKQEHEQEGKEGKEHVNNAGVDKFGLKFY